MIQALDAKPEDADTLVVDYFPDLLEHTELVTRLGDLRPKRLIFRKASRTHGYFLSSNAHARLDTFNALGIPVYWYDEMTKDLYLHTYRRDHGFFVKEEMARKFQEATILAFYGSAVGLDQADTDRIASLVNQLTAFMGSNLGVLTGGGGGVMRLATETARIKGALTGACFLELEAQPPSSAWISSTPSRKTPATSGKNGSRPRIFASSTSAASARSRKSASSSATSSSASARASRTCSSTRNSGATFAARSAR